MFEQRAIFFWDDDDDLRCQCCKLYPQAYMQMMSKRPFMEPTVLYTAHFGVVIVKQKCKG